MGRPPIPIDSSYRSRRALLNGTSRGRAGALWCTKRSTIANDGHAQLYSGSSLSFTEDDVLQPASPYKK